MIHAARSNQVHSTYKCKGAWMWSSRQKEGYLAYKNVKCRYAGGGNLLQLGASDLHVSEFWLSSLPPPPSPAAAKLRMARHSGLVQRPSWKPATKQVQQQMKSNDTTNHKLQSFVICRRIIEPFEDSRTSGASQRIGTALLQLSM